MPTRVTARILSTSSLLAATVLLCTSGARAAVPAADITLQPPIYDGLPVLGTVTGYEMDSGCPAGWSPQNCQTPLYVPYDRNTPRWWDNLVEELLASRVHVVMAHGRGCFDPVSGTGGNGNMCPRLLSNLVAAINRANAAGVLRIAMFDDTGAYPGARNTFLNLPQGTPFDLSDQSSWDEVIWKRNIQIWHDTVPSSLWFRLDGRPVIAFWSLADAFFSHQQGNASRLLDFLRNRFIARYGESPVFILDRTWTAEDTTITASHAYGVNDWFNPSIRNYTYFTWNGRDFGASVPGFRDPNTPPGCGSLCREYPRQDGASLSTALQEGINRRARFTLLEGWTDIGESAGYYRSASWRYPSQYINVVREFSDRRTTTLKLEAEAADAFVDFTAGNFGGQYRNGDLDVAALPGSGWAVGWTDAGESIQLNEVSLSEGSYRFSARASSGAGGRTVQLKIDGVSLGSVAVPFGGSWDAYDTFTLGTAFVGHGRHTLQVVFDNGLVNLDWIFVKKIDPAAGFRTDNGHYLVAESGGGERMYANRTSQGAWESFTLIDRNGGSLQSGDPIRLQAHDGYYVAAELGGGDTVNANRWTPGAWEEFRIIRTAGPGVISNGDQVAIQSINNNYFSAEAGGGGLLNANRTAIGPWETFTISLAPQ
jgi:Domain of unknown function (DUF5010)/DUF5010 C-terminal domain